MTRVRWARCWLVATVAMLGAACGGESQKAAGTGGPSSDGGTAGTGGAQGGTGSARGGSSSVGGGPAGTSSGGGSGGGAGSEAGRVSTAGTGGASGGVAGTSDASDAGESGEGGVAGMAVGGAAGTGGVVDVPGFDDFIIYSSHMGMYEGLTMIGTFDHNFGEPSRSPPRASVIRAGAFELVWPQLFNRDSFGTYMTLFVDYNGDGWCTEGTDPAWADFVSNDLGADRPQIHEFDPNSLPNSVGPITCAEFDEWFDESYPGI